MGIIEQLAEIKYQEGIQEGLEKVIRRLLTNTELSAPKIAQVVGVRLTLVKKIKKDLNNK